jgi:hypothetical protein
LGSPPKPTDGLCCNLYRISQIPNAYRWDILMVISVIVVGLGSFQCGNEVDNSIQLDPFRHFDVYHRMLLKVLPGTSNGE